MIAAIVASDRKLLMLTPPSAPPIASESASETDTALTRISPSPMSTTVAVTGWPARVPRKASVIRSISTSAPTMITAPVSPAPAEIVSAVAMCVPSATTSRSLAVTFTVPSAKALVRPRIAATGRTIATASPTAAVRAVVVASTSAVRSATALMTTAPDASRSAERANASTSLSTVVLA